MSLSTTSIVKQGAKRTFSRNGLIIAAVLYVLAVVDGIIGIGATRYIASLPAEATGSASVAAPLILAGVISLLIGLATFAVLIGAYRLFVTDETERIPREYFTRNMGWALVSYIIGSIVFGIVVGVGFVLLVVPGIFVLVSLLFWGVYVAVEDQNFIEGMRSSWGLSKGHRLELFIIGVAVVLITMIVSAVFDFGAIFGDLIGLLVAQIGAAFATVFTTAAIAQAYTDLRSTPEIGEMHSSEGPAGTPGETPESI